ncbi:methylmalonyl-CoA epimerase [Saccharothrix lopnurensis]|uniref:Methylmalonyl-CoA epimerase n=1 Tax=Saccharothrix lopnurensis TaxID=1670621 RepID=A0ABW1PIU5_9PSEU
MFTRVDHIGIACRDLDRTVEHYRSVFGFEVCHVEVNEGQGVREAMLRVNGTDDGGATYLQLLEPISPDSTVARWIERHGEGVHHIAFGSPDVHAVVEDLRGHGPRVLFDPPRRASMGSTATFLHPKDCHGVLTEVVTSAGEDRSSGVRADDLPTA